MNTTPTPTPTTDAQQFIEVRVNPTSDVFLFDFDPNKQHIWLYVKDTASIQASIHFDTRYQFFVDWHSPCTDIHITTDQWNHFIKRLTLLSSSIRSLAEHLNIGMTQTSLIKRPDTSTILAIRWSNEPILHIAIYDTGSKHYDELLHSTNYMVPYDSQLDEYISRFMKEISDTMNQWLKLN